MKAGDIKTVVDKLIGNIHPIASSRYDMECLENIEEYINLCDKMIFDLCHIAYKYKDSPYSSASKVGAKAFKYIVDLNDSLSEDLK